MDWSSIGSAISQFAPTLGGALGSLAGPVGTAAGTLAGNIVAAALGTTPTPEAVSQAIAADPAGAQAKITAAEATHGPAVKSAQELDNEDRAGARSQTVQLVQAGSSIAWGAPIISMMVAGGFIGLVFALLYKQVPDNQVTLILFGALSAAFTQVVNYWLGSSRSSATKDDTISNALMNAAAPAGRAVERAIDRVIKK